MRSLNHALSLLLPVLAVAACSSQRATTTTPPNTGSTPPVVSRPAPATTAPAAVGAGMAAVVDHTYTIANGEFVRVFLEGGATYQAELNGPNLQLVLKPVDASLQAPLVEPLVPGTSASGTSIFTIHPRQDGEYEFVSQGGDAARPVSLHLTRQATGSKP